MIRFLRAAVLWNGALAAILAAPSPLQAVEVQVAIRNPAGVFVTTGASGLEGFDLELLDRFAAWHRTRYSEALEFHYDQVGTIDELLDRAQKKGCEFGIGSITITAERAKKVDFSESYIPVRMVLFARAGKFPEGSLETRLRGKRLGAIEGSTGVTRITTLQKDTPDIVSKAYPDYQSLFAALLGNPAEIDGVVTDVTHYWVLSAKEKLELVAPMSEEQGLGLVLPKGSPWKAKIDAFLAEFRSTPGYFQLVRRYFGKEASDMLMFSKQGS